MRIAVIGGTGVAGRPAAEEAARRGHEVVVVGRHRPEQSTGQLPPGAEFAAADAVTGEGLAAALRGAGAVIDASNITTQNEERATAFFTTATRNLLAAEAEAGTGTHVVLSIVGIDDVPMGYYKGKVAQEAAARAAAGDAGVRTVVVRATQFHDFAGQVIAMTAKGPLAAVPVMATQTVSTADLAVALVDAAEGGTPDLVQIGGPEANRLPDLVRRTLAQRGRRALVLPVPVPGAAGRAMRGGALRVPAGAPGARTGTETFASWLARQS